MFKGGETLGVPTSAAAAKLTGEVTAAGAGVMEGQKGNDGKEEGVPSVRGASLHYRLRIDGFERFAKPTAVATMLEELGIKGVVKVRACIQL